MAREPFRIGISGWRYKGWRGAFYPRGLPQREELSFASRSFNSVEINGSFYSLQRPESWIDWYESTPHGFTFAVKGPRFVTHMKKLVDIERPVANFFASGLLALKEKLGPILWQFPEMVRYDAERFERFFALLPRTSEEALSLARRRDKRMLGRSYLRLDAVRGIRHAVEIRHESFRDAAFVSLLKKYGVALVVADTAGKFPLLEDVTSDFVYVRLHGSTELYSSGYSPEELAFWADRLRTWSDGGSPADARLAGNYPPTRRKRAVYLYFDNDAKVHAPFNAQALMTLLCPRSAAVAVPSRRRS